MLTKYGEKIYNFNEGERKMSCFSKFCKKGATINKKLSIDENLYQDLTELSKCTYDASISKLVNAAIEDLLNTKNVALYKKENTNQVSRSFLIREDFLNGLYELKENYSVSINSLVNIAIRNAVTEEKMESEGLDKLN